MKWTREKKEALLASLHEAHARGLDDREIAETLDISLSSVWRLREENGLPSNYVRPKTGPRKRHAVVKMPRWEIAARSIERRTKDINYYEDDKAEFLRAIQAFRSKHRRIPTLVESFRILQGLGYRKDVPQ